MRKPHQKTRTGCHQCRQRRIKCPEDGTTCGQCRRHSLDCTYPSSSEPRARTSLAAARTAVVSSRASYTSTNPSPSRGASLNAPTKVLDINLMDLELLHTYTTSTDPAFANDVWQRRVPNVAFTSKYLMHGLLAYASTHLATLQPMRRDKLLQAAAAHEAMALPHYRQAVGALNPGNFDYVLIFGAFVLAYTSAIGSEGSDELPPQWLLLMRSSMLLLSHIWPWFVSGPSMSDSGGPKLRVDIDADPDQHQLNHLLKLLQDDFVLGGDTPDDIAAYKDAIATLSWSSAMMADNTSPICNQSMAYVWPRFAPARYFELVRTQRPVAMIILAYYSVLKFDSEFVWYFRGQARSMLDAILRTLPHKYHEWLQWPMQRVMFGSQRSTCIGHGPDGHIATQCTAQMLFYSPSQQSEYIMYYAQPSHITLFDHKVTGDPSGWHFALEELQCNLDP